jgi:hypothetical protein
MLINRITYLNYLNMKKISYIVLFIFTGLLLGCENTERVVIAPHVSFENDRVFGLSPGEPSSTQDIKVYTNTTTGVDRVYSLVVVEALTTLTAAEYAVPGTVTIPANSREGQFPVTVTSSNLGSGKNLAIDFGPIQDGTFDGAPLKLKAAVVCPLNDIAFQLVLDRYGSESSWNIVNGAGVIVAFGGPYTDTGTNAAQAPRNFSFCLANGNYVFTMFDSYGDGITGGSGNGSFKLTNVKTGVVLVTGGTFASQSVHPFTLN